MQYIFKMPCIGVRKLLSSLDSAVKYSGIIISSLRNEIRITNGALIAMGCGRCILFKNPRLGRISFYKFCPNYSHLPKIKKKCIFLPNLDTSGSVRFKMYNL